MRIQAGLLFVAALVGCSHSINRDQCAARFSGASQGMTPEQTSQMRDDCFRCVDSGQKFGNQSYSCGGAPNERLASAPASAPAPAQPAATGPTDIFGQPIPQRPAEAAPTPAPAASPVAAEGRHDVPAPAVPAAPTVEHTRVNGNKGTATEPGQCAKTVSDSFAPSDRPDEEKRCGLCVNGKSVYRVYETSKRFSTCERAR